MAKRTKWAHPSRVAYLAVYAYLMADGSPGWFKGRLPGKRFTVWHVGAKGGTVKNKGPNDPVLYNLPAVLMAVARGLTIYVTEGEKDADALIARGYVATTTGGAGYWPPEATALLAGAKRVVIVMDLDSDGRSHAFDVFDALEAEVGRVELRAPAAGNDAYDHLVTHGMPVEQLLPTLRIRNSAELAPKTRTRTTRAVIGSQPSSNGFAQSVLDAKLGQVRAAQVGHRNCTLNGCAYYLFRLGHGGTYDCDTLDTLLTDAGLTTGLRGAEIRATLKSAKKAAEKRPRAFYEVRSARIPEEERLIGCVKSSVLARVWRGKGERYRKRVLLALVKVLEDRMGTPSDFVASISDIQAAGTLKSRSSVIRALRILAEDGWLSLLKKGSREGLASRWALNIPAFARTEEQQTNPNPCPGVSRGAYSDALDLDHPAFLPSCWGFAGYELLPYLSRHEAQTTAVLAANAKLSVGTARRSLRRMADAGVLIRERGGWRRAASDVRVVAHEAAVVMGAADERAVLLARLAAHQRSFRAWLKWYRTPKRLRPQSSARTGLVLTLEAA